MESYGFLYTSNNVTNFLADRQGTGKPLSSSSSGVSLGGALNKGYSDSELGGKAAVSKAGSNAHLAGNESGYSGSSSLSTVFTIFPVQEPPKNDHLPDGATSLCKTMCISMIRELCTCTHHPRCFVRIMQVYAIYVEMSSF